MSKHKFTSDRSDMAHNIKRALSLSTARLHPVKMLSLLILSASLYQPYISTIFFSKL